MTRNEVLVALANGSMKLDDASALLDTLDKSSATVAALYVKANPESRTISLYGLGRMPVTLYRSQWERLVKDGAKVVTEFIEKHSEYLPAAKSDTSKAVPKTLIGDKGSPFRVPKLKVA